MPRPIRRPPAKAPPVAPDRVRGALFGLSSGDALGVPVDGRRLQAPPFPALVRGAHAEMVGGGRHALKPGQVTSLTQSACCLSESLRAQRGYDLADAVRRYVEWLPVGVDVEPPVTEAMTALKGQYADPRTIAKTLWLKSNRKAASNVSLVRTAPLGLFLATEAAARRRASLEDSAITHFDPRCQLACVALNEALATAVQGPKAPEPKRWVHAAESAIAVASAELAQNLGEFLPEIQAARASLLEDLRLAQSDDPLLYGPELHVWAQANAVRVTFRLAFWTLFHAPDVETGLVDVVNRGGNACANAAVAGALLGARDGEAAIPERWRTALLEALSFRAQGPLWNVYRPRILLELAS